MTTSKPKAVTLPCRLRAQPWVLFGERGAALYKGDQAMFVPGDEIYQLINALAEIRAWSGGREDTTSE